MTHDPREALEPCPFCGTELDIDRNISDTGVYWVMCHQCCAEGPPVNPKAEAIKAWNTRALTASPGERKPVACADWGQLVQCLLRIMDHPHKGENSTEQAERMATELCRKYPAPTAAGLWNDTTMPKRPFAFAVQRPPENGQDKWRLFMDEGAARAEAEQLDGDYEALYRIGDRRSAIEALRREAPAPEGVSTPPAAVESNASVEAIELAYGLLWVVGCDRSTRGGNALYLARKALLEQLDRAGQGRGISAARKVLKNEEAGCGGIGYSVSGRVPCTDCPQAAASKICLTKFEEILLRAAKAGLNYIANTEAELGIILESGDLLREAIGKIESYIDGGRSSRAQSEDARKKGE